MSNWPVTTYLYCLLPAASEPPPATLTGIAGEPVRRLDAGGIAAWVGTIAGEVARSVETARRHDAVIRAALATGTTPLPARAGQRFADDGACAAEIGRRERAITDALGRVAGCVEMTVHVDAALPDVSEQPHASTGGGGRGREYLERLRARRTMERSVQGGLDGIRAELAADDGVIRGEVSRAGDEAGSLVVSHLVPRDAVSRYREAFRALAGTGRVTGVRVGGPYAPYSFSEIEHE